jgi:transcriptional regulator with XRE-family HTH domain
MATVEIDQVQMRPAALSESEARNASREKIHRIRTVRLQQGVSLRTAARHTGVTIRKLRVQENESSDLLISELRQWQKCLDVPIAELLVEPDAPLSRPVMERARLVRLMKTAAAILEHSSSTRLKRMARMMVEQLVEIMPELQHVSAWHTFGQRRSLDEYGRIVERQLSEDLLFQHRRDDD